MMPNDQRIIEALNAAGIDFDAEGFDASKPFRDNGIDSLDVMSLFLALEERFKTKFSEGEASAIRTPIDLTNALDKKLR